MSAFTDIEGDAEKFQRRGPDKALQLFFSSASRATYDLEDDNKQSLFEQALKKLGPQDRDTGRFQISSATPTQRSMNG
jgi:hypothetical protein